MLKQRKEKREEGRKGEERKKKDYIYSGGRLQASCLEVSSILSISGRLEGGGVDRCIPDGGHDCGLLNSPHSRIGSSWWISQCVRAIKKWISTTYN